MQLVLQASGIHKWVEKACGRRPVAGRPEDLGRPDVAVKQIADIVADAEAKIMRRMEGEDGVV